MKSYVRRLYILNQSHCTYRGCRQGGLIWKLECRLLSQYLSETSCDRPTQWGLPPFSPVLEQNPLLHCILLMRTSHHKLQNFRPNAAFQTEFSPDAHLLSRDACRKNPLPNALPSHRPIFTRKEREQPENLQSSKFIFSPPVLIHVVPLNTPQILLLCLFFSLLKVNYDLMLYYAWLLQCTVICCSHLFTQVTALFSKLCRLRYKNTV
jgi:hypothetical protein